ncbi:uncharacterized protein LOC136073019 [Hydra vulgaris]|uniref:uncharacterized protein LOC136073019 n=1 Tax=Hydra vulgaris TaxID=6087 RepID=UPI0032E9CD32
MILSELEKFQAMTEQIRTKSKKDINEQTKESIFNKGVEKGTNDIIEALNMKFNKNQTTDIDTRLKIAKKLEGLKKSVYQDSINEKLGYDTLQTNLEKLYKPLIDSQSGIKEGISKLENKADQIANTFSNYPALLDSETKAIMPPEVVDKMSLGPIATEYLKLYTTKNSKKSDDIFGNDITIEGKKYTGTPGLWEIIVKSHPVRYTNDDRNKYKEILDQTDAIRSDLNTAKPRSSRSYKYTNVIKPIWEEMIGKSGKGVVILPSDPNALFEMLKLRLAGLQAGNTGTRNEIVAICDELLRQDSQKEKIKKAIESDTNASIKLSYEDLNGEHKTALTESQRNRMKAAYLTFTE